VADTARMLGCTRHHIDKMVKAYKQGGDDAVRGLRWTRGRPPKFLGFSQEEIDTMVSRLTLMTQAGMSLKARAG
jgi:hypothetical protein